MTTKQAELAFNKMLHPDLNGEVFFSIEDYQFDTTEGIVVLLDNNFDTLFKFDPRMIHHFFWYFKDPKNNYIKALSSKNPLDTILVLLDKQTGSRCIDDWNNEENETINFFYKLRKKFQ